jgi:ataxia telangiectasia mutated family protein
MPVDPSCTYKVLTSICVLLNTRQDIVSVTNFGDKYQLVGGLNLPKLIECTGSNGYSYKQLVKGKDDLRQDAVMQQMFQLVNTLLYENPETRKRRLKIRTYKVIPLTPTSGLLEWVENTIPIGEYLIGNPKNQTNCAHYRYHPKDWMSANCRKELTDANEKNKYQKYLDVCDHFTPSFHHFFLENFSTPAEWFEKRLTYTRSVASNSIVGTKKKKFFIF